MRFALLVGSLVLLAGCGTSAAAPNDSPSPSTSPGPASAADRLAGLVAVAQDHAYVATYQFSAAGRAKRTITVTTAADGTWRVDVPGGALGGGKDMSVAGTRDGVYQCAPSCVQVARAGGAVPAQYDPQVEKVFLDWVPKLADHDAPLSVADATLSGAPGHCFSVEPTAASLSSPVPAGIYCLGSDGTVTGARVGIGTLVRTGTPTAGPKTVTLSAPVTAGSPVPTASPSPSPSPSPSGSPSPSTSAG